MSRSQKRIKASTILIILLMAFVVATSSVSIGINIGIYIERNSSEETNKEITRD